MNSYYNGLITNEEVIKELLKAAEEIADFHLSVKDKVDLLICQCEHGQSRSAAVAAAVLEYQNKSGIEIFADDNYYPNKMVFKKVLDQMRKRG